MPNVGQITGWSCFIGSRGSRMKHLHIQQLSTIGSSLKKHLNSTEHNAPICGFLQHITGIICLAQDQYVCIALVLFYCIKLFQKIFAVGYQIPPFMVSVSAKRSRSLFALATFAGKGVRL